MNSLDKLVILWTNGDPITAENMVFMYAENALKKSWWHEITIIVWGASTALLAGDQKMKDHIRRLIDTGVEVVACQACAEKLGVLQDLSQLGIDVKYMGEPLTEYIKLDYKILTI